jgi:hypothetical protein
LNDSDTSGEHRTLRCPDCAAEIPLDERYPAWRACGWGLVEPPTLRPPSAARRRRRVALLDACTGTLYAG